MTAVTRDSTARSTVAPGAASAAASAHPGLGPGLLLALVSALAFGTAGAVARGLLDSGWSPGATVLVRVSIGALAVLPFGVHALRGRWVLLRRSAGVVVLYGALAVAVAQFCYFSAVQHMQVAPALLVEYAAPVVVVGWMWWRRGEKPSALTLAGAAVAVAGLVLVLDLFSGAEVSVVGMAWALAAMVGLAGYFVISADERNGLPPMALASGGLVVGAVLLGLLGLTGLMPMSASTADAQYATFAVAWWVPLVVLGLVSAGFAYGTGIAASRRLGSRLASFVALLEVLAAVGFSWWLLAELPGAVQLAGGALVLLGVVGVRAGERRVVRREPLPA
ncbi:DMT family transporter [Nocardioides perillae]|uniref:EamA family transporter n=1 Tax=Nocardioides perillae TaxID=1119534 RepID=UPI0015C9139B